MGNGKTNASGFKVAFAEDSPQVEHAMAGIYLSKIKQPGAIGFWGTLVEVAQGLSRGDFPSFADIALYAVAEDFGDRISESNYKESHNAARRTFCE
jgi:hypothetical protein